LNQERNRFHDVNKTKEEKLKPSEISMVVSAVAVRNLTKKASLKSISVKDRTVGT
jgi:hypothetical protein